MQLHFKPVLKRPFEGFSKQTLCLPFRVLVAFFVRSKLTPNFFLYYFNETVMNPLKSKIILLKCEQICVNHPNVQLYE